MPPLRSRSPAASAAGSLENRGEFLGPAACPSGSPPRGHGGLPGSRLEDRATGWGSPGLSFPWGPLLSLTVAWRNSRLSMAAFKLFPKDPGVGKLTLVGLHVRDDETKWPGRHYGGSGAPPSSGQAPAIRMPMVRPSPDHQVHEMCIDCFSRFRRLAWRGTRGSWRRTPSNSRRLTSVWQELPRSRDNGLVRYHEPLFNTSEAESFILQATLGCS